MDTATQFKGLSLKTTKSTDHVTSWVTGYNPFIHFLTLSGVTGLPEWLVLDKSRAHPRQVISLLQGNNHTHSHHGILRVTTYKACCWTVGRSRSVWRKAFH